MEKTIETVELCNMLLDDIKHSITQWSYEKLWEMLGRNGSYPKPNTMLHIKWGWDRGSKKDSVNKYFESQKESVRIVVAFGTNNEGDILSNQWRAIPKDELQAWCALESATKIISPMILAARRSLLLSNSTGLSMETKITLKALSASINSVSNSVLKNCQSIDGLNSAQLTELQEWYNRKMGFYKRLLEAK